MELLPLGGVGYYKIVAVRCLRAGGWRARLQCGCFDSRCTLLWGAGTAARSWEPRSRYLAGSLRSTRRAPRGLRTTEHRRGGTPLALFDGSFILFYFKNGFCGNTDNMLQVMFTCFHWFHVSSRVYLHVLYVWEIFNKMWNNIFFTYCYIKYAPSVSIVFRNGSLTSSFKHNTFSFVIFSDMTDPGSFM